MRWMILVAGYGAIGLVGFVAQCLPVPPELQLGWPVLASHIASWTLIAFLLACVRGARRKAEDALRRRCHEPSWLPLGCLAASSPGNRSSAAEGDAGPQ
jgi:hypothetical protein